MNEKRNSNMELLRIFAMLMIISFHIFDHCIKIQLTDLESIKTLNNGLFCHPIFYGKIMLLSTLSPLGKVGNVIFILISGFFSAAKSTNINLKKTSVKLLSQQFFAALTLTVGSAFLWKVLGDKYVSLINFNIFNNMSWFIGYYFILMVFAFLFLNKFLRGLDKNKYSAFVVIIFAFSQFSWALRTANNLANGINTLIIGVFLYALGGYIKLYNPFGKIKAVYIFLCIVFAFGLVWLSTYNAINLDIEDYVGKAAEKPFVQNIPKYNDWSLISVMLGISVFELFRRMNIGSIKAINFIGSSTLMIYLLHDNKFVYYIWLSRDWVSLLYNNPVRFVGELLLCALVVFTFGFMIYCVFLLFEKLFCRLFLKAQQQK